MLYRFAAGGPISASMGTFGTRTLLVPSADKNLYAVDLFTAETKWTFPSGARSCKSRSWPIMTSTS